MSAADAWSESVFFIFLWCHSCGSITYFICFPSYIHVSLSWSCSYISVLIDLWCHQSNSLFGSKKSSCAWPFLRVIGTRLMWGRGPNQGQVKKQSPCPIGSWNTGICNGTFDIVVRTHKDRWLLRFLQERTEDLDPTLATDQHGGPTRSTMRSWLGWMAYRAKSWAPKVGHCLIMHEA